MEHFFVRRLMVEWYNWNAIVYLISERIHGVVYDYHVFHASIGNDSQVFNIVTFRCLHAMLPIKPVLKELILRINIV